MIIYLTILAGTPYTVELFGMSLITKEPAPIITLFPISIFWIIVEPIPSKQFEPIFTCPAIFTPGHIWVYSEIIDSWSIIALLLIIDPKPICTSACITAFANIATPGLIIAVGEKEAFEFIRFGQVYPNSINFWNKLFLKILSPIATKPNLYLFLIDFVNISSIFPITLLFN